MVPRSKTVGRKVLTSKWVFVEKQKIDDDGICSPYLKARNVVRDFLQAQGVDCGAIFAPVVQYIGKCYLNVVTYLV